MMFAWKSWSPAIALCVLVGAVFASLQGFGPESTLRKFHIAAANGDVSTMQALAVEPTSSQNIMMLQSRILELARNGYQYDVRSIQRSKDFRPTSKTTDRVVAEVIYTHRYRRVIIPMLFVLDKSGAKWQVNAQSSLSLMSQVGSAPGTSY